MTATLSMTLSVDFAGEVFDVSPDDVFTIGREGTLALDDNPYLHRNFLQVSHRDGLWWLSNVGSRIPATITDSEGLMRSVLAPGGSAPLVFPENVVTFSAGPTTYELGMVTRVMVYAPPAHKPQNSHGTTIAPTAFTDSQLQVILALAEPVLTHVGSGAWEIPSAVSAAKRLGWTQTRFNRKLDNVCDKLDRCGVSGLRGGPGNTASMRRVRLVEYAVSTLLVTSADLPLLNTTTSKDS